LLIAFTVEEIDFERFTGRKENFDLKGYKFEEEISTEDGKTLSTTFKTLFSTGSGILLKESTSLELIL
jgi:hypothetical protein